jgi:hypothetical protein
MPFLREMQYKEFLYDFTVNGGAQGAITLGALPVGAVPVSAHAITEVAVVGVNATIQLGNTTDDDQLIAATAITAVNVAGKVIGGVAAALRQLLVANDLVLAIKIVTADLTAGKVRFVVGFYMPSNAPVSTTVG